MQTCQPEAASRCWMKCPHRLAGRRELLRVKGISLAAQSLAPRFRVSGFLSLAAVLLLLAAPVIAANHQVTRFATLPTGPGLPASIAADASGNIIVGTSELTEFFGSELPGDPLLLRAIPGSADQVEMSLAAANFIYTFSSCGALSFIPMARAGRAERHGRVGQQAVRRRCHRRQRAPVHVLLSNASLPAVTYDVCGGLAVLLLGATGTFCNLDEIEVGPDGNLYIADAAASDLGQFTGRIWVLTPGSPANTGSIFFANTALNPNGFPGWVRGLAFRQDKSALLVSNVSTDTILKLAVQAQNPGQPPSTTNPLVPGALSEFLESSAIDGPMDLAFDGSGLLWVTSSQKHQVVVVNKDSSIVETMARSRLHAGRRPAAALRPVTACLFRRGRVHRERVQRDPRAPRPNRLHEAEAVHGLAHRPGDPASTVVQPERRG